MSLTPIEGENEPADGTPSEGPASGVRGSLRSALGAVVRRVLGVVRGESTSRCPDSRERYHEDDPTASDAAIRPAGQARLDGGRVSRQLPDGSGGADGESKSRVEAEEVDGRLRIHRPGEPETYVSSDVYERIER